MDRIERSCLISRTLKFDQTSTRTLSKVLVQGKNHDLAWWSPVVPPGVLLLVLTNTNLGGQVALIERVETSKLDQNTP
jgi:hypothetical protein